MTTIQIDAGTLQASESDRTVTGLLVPYGEQCASNLGKFSVDPGAFTVPADLAGMSLNIEHRRENVIGSPVSVRETDKGIVATFSIARTPEGDQALADVAAGRRRSLSAEVAEVAIRAGRAVAGRLFAAALVEKPAFPSATLLASAPDTLQAEEVTATSDEGTFTDENGVVWRRVEQTATDVEVSENGTQTTTTTTVVEEAPQDATEADDNTEEEAPVVAQNTLAAKMAATTEPAKVEERPTLLASQVFQLIAEAKNGNKESMSTLMAALTDVKITGTGAAAGTGVIRDAWVGQMWQGRSYERKFISLGRLGTEISAAGKSGFKAFRGTAASPVDTLGGTWAGNKAEVSSGTIHTTKHSSTLRKWAFGADIAREFFDLPGGSEIIEAMVRLVIEDYAIWSDEAALADIIAAAGTPVAPTTTAPAEYSDSLAMLIQGTLAVRRAKDVPTFALVNETAYEELLYTPKDLIPEFVSFAFNTEGTGSADGGKLVVVEAPDSAFAAIDADTPAVLVGAQNGIEFDEIGSTPIVVDAVEIAKGGIDRGVYGYLQTFPVRSESFVLIGTDTP
jgi:hypothetical protein